MNTTKLIFVLIITVFATSSYAAKPGSYMGTNYQFVGTSTASTPPYLGLEGMNNLCRSEFGSEARMCNTKEFYQTPDTSHSSLNTQWIHPELITSWYDSARMKSVHTIYPSATVYDDLEYSTCSSWGGSDSNHNGTVLRTYSGYAKWHLTTQSCLEQAQVACCAPQ